MAFESIILTDCAILAAAGIPCVMFGADGGGAHAAEEWAEEESVEALAEIRTRGVTILLVEQRAQLCVGFADRTYVLSNGEIRMTLTRRDVGDTERMVAAGSGVSP